MRWVIFFSIGVIGVLCASSVSAAQEKISLDLQDVRLSDAIRIVAKFTHQNVVVSPKVQGTVTLHYHEAAAPLALNMLLASERLASTRQGAIHFVEPQEELEKATVADAKWRTVQEKLAVLETDHWQVRYANVRDIARLLKDEQAGLLSSRGQVRVDPRTNIIFIQDRAEKLALVRRLLAHIDVPVKQILIETRLASVDSDFKRELGLTFTTADVAGGYSLAIAKLADGSLLDVKLSALENAGHAELISRPSLFTANLQTAMIEAGEEVPYQEVSESGGTAVVFKKAVLGFRVTPQLLPGNQVLLKLHINQDRPSSHLVLGVPTISTRQMTTSVLAKNGQTVVLGGIYETNRDYEEERIPFISGVPLIGELFKRRSMRRAKRELLIFVTPNIVE